MKERQFAGMLNYRNLYGMSYYDSDVLRFKKYCKVDDLCIPHNPLKFKWYKSKNIIFPSWSKSLWNYAGEITYSQRGENAGRKKKKFEMFRWRDV